MLMCLVICPLTWDVAQGVERPVSGNRGGVFGGGRFRPVLRMDNDGNTGGKIMDPVGKRKACSILIVDDELANLQLLGGILLKEGYAVEFAMEGAEALAQLTATSFDLILLDIMMPGMSGYEVCEAIKDDMATTHIPVIFITSKNEPEAVLKGFEAGGSDYITKPFNAHELLARVKVHAEVKRLRGLIPICASCKSIRNNEGIWGEIEAYIEEHADVLFTHSVCSGCMEKLYGSEMWYKAEKERKARGR